MERGLHLLVAWPTVEFSFLRFQAQKRRFATNFMSIYKVLSFIYLTNDFTGCCYQCRCLLTIYLKENSVTVASQTFQI